MKARCTVNAMGPALLLAALVLLEASPMTEAQAQNAEPVAASKEYTYKQTPQGDLKIFVDFPAGWSAADKRPAIVFFFGGGWNAGSVGQFADQARYLADRGLVAARADYRVKTRHGVTPDKCVEDAKTAMRWVKAHAAELGIDPDKVIASGGSAGGHLAACVATTPGLDAEGDDLSISTKPCALVLFNPVLNLTLAERLIERVDSKETAAAISPTLNLTRDTPAAIIFYGTEDQMLSMGKEYCTKAKALGVRAEMYTGEGQAHGFFNKPPWKQTTLLKADEFLVSLGYLTGKPTVEAPAEGGELKRWEQ
jgi:acetyl esterase/lipase